MKCKQIETKKVRKTNCPLNEPGDYPLQDMMIFMAGHQHESINVKDTETSFMVFHQNIRGLLNKSEELISSLSPDFPQVLYLTEHHLRHFKIDFIYMDKYKFGTKFCRESLKSGGVSIFVPDTLQCTNKILKHVRLRLIYYP